MSDISTFSGEHDNLLLDIFSNANIYHVVQDNVNTSLTYHDLNVQALAILPYILIPNQPFLHFNVDRLIEDTIFETKLHNRSICYYGHYNYTYSVITHKAQAIPASGNPKLSQWYYRTFVLNITKLEI